MGRPQKTLLQRCRERSFRPGRHWRLLLEQPDLGHPSLAQLQHQAREAEGEDQAKEIARQFERTLRDLPAQEPRPPAPAPAAAADHPGGHTQPPMASPASERTEAIAAAVEAALADLASRYQTDLTPSESLEIELIRTAGERLAAIHQRLNDDGLTVYGSKRQLRPHPLLAVEAALRRELSHNLRQLETRVHTRAQLERLIRITRAQTPKPHRTHETAWLPNGPPPGGD